MSHSRPELADALGFIQVDSTQLHQVNLVTNGIEAMFTSARSLRVLRVITEADNDGGLLPKVADSGPGIDSDMFERIFYPMFTTKPDGMGLGLSICRSIIGAHGGGLRVSPNPTGASIFQFSIPEEAK